MSLEEKKLTYKERKALKGGSFVFPKDRRYPIPDKAHARNALARVAQHGTPSEKAKVRAAVHRKFPGIGDQDESIDHLIPRVPLQELQEVGLVGEDCGYDEPDEPGYAGCPACGGDGVLLGALGNRKHYRCRQCGMDFSQEEAETGD